MSNEEFEKWKLIAKMLKEANDETMRKLQEERL